MAAVSSNKVVIKWSLFYIAVSIILTFVYQFLSIDQNSAIKYISFIPYIAFMALALKEFMDELGGYMSYGTAFLTAFKYVVITDILSILFSYIYMTLINPQMYQDAIDAMKTKWQQSGMADEQVNKMAGIFTPFIISLVAFLFLLIAGTIIALIVAAFFKKDKPAFMENDINYTDPAV